MTARRCVCGEVHDTTVIDRLLPPGAPMPEPSWVTALWASSPQATPAAMTTVTDRAERAPPSVEAPLGRRSFTDWWAWADWWAEQRQRR